MGNDVNKKNLGIDSSVLGTAKIRGKWRRSMENGSNMCGNDNYLKNGLKMWKMT